MKTQIPFFRRVVILLSCLLIYFSSQSLSAQLFSDTSPLLFDGGVASFVVPASGIECANSAVSLQADIDGTTILFGAVTIAGPGINLGSISLNGTDAGCGSPFQVESIPIVDLEDFSCLPGGSTLDYTVTFDGAVPACASVLITLSFNYLEPEAPTPITATPTAMDLDPDFENFNACAADAIDDLRAAGAFFRTGLDDFYQDNCATIPGDVTRIFNRRQELTVDEDCGWTVEFKYNVRDNCNLSANLIDETIIFTGSDQTEPTAITQDPMPEVDLACQAVISATDVNNGSSDNCLEEVTLLVSTDGILSTDPATTAAASVTLTADFSAGCPEVQEVYLHVIDECGNETVSPAQDVTLRDAILPMVNSQDPGLADPLDVDADCQVVVAAADINDNSSDNCTAMGALTLLISTDGILSTDPTATAAATVTLTGDFSGACPQVQQVYLHVIDECGNEAMSVQDVSIEDLMAPTALTQDPGTLDPLDVDVDCQVVVAASDINNGSDDNCTTMGALTLLVSTDGVLSTDPATTAAATVTLTGDFSTVCPQVQQVFLHVIDECGNETVSLAQDVTIEDKLVPTASGTLDAAILNNELHAAPGTAIVVDANCSVTINATDIIDASTDNCTDFANSTLDKFQVFQPSGTWGSSATFSQANGDFSFGGFLAPSSCPATFDLLYRVIDDCGNSSDPFTIEVTVVDETPPTFPVAVPDFNIDANSQCVTSIVVDVVFPTDNCGLDGLGLFNLLPTLEIIDNATNLPAIGITVSPLTVVVPINLVWNVSNLPVGSFTGIVSVPDVCGNVGTDEFEIIINDVTTPVVTCPADLTGADAVSTDLDACNALITFPAAATSSDGCGLASLDITFAGDPGDMPIAVPMDITNIGTGIGGTNSAFSATFEKGTTIITYTFTDVNGQSDFCEQIVTVVDNQDPDFTYSADQTITTSTNSALCPAVAPLTDLVAGAINFGDDLSTPGFFMVAGVLFKAPSSTTMTDNCPEKSLAVSSVTVDQTTGILVSTVCSSTVNIVWEVTDCGGNTATQEQVITVVDDTAPTWTTAVGSLDRTVECSDAVGLAAAQALFPDAMDICDTDVTNVIKILGGFVVSARCSQEGTYTNTWTVSDDCGNTSVVFEQVITIEDTNPPTWTDSVGDLDVTLECSDATGIAAAQTLEPVATDICDTDVTNVVKISGVFVASTSCPQEGTYTNTWTVTDDCGNVSEEFEQVITIEDTNPPTWTDSVGDLDVTLECSDAAGIAAAQALEPVATDICDTDVTNVVKNSGVFVASASCPQEGTYTNSWTVSDDCGNTSVAFEQVITIEDNTPPVVAPIVLPPAANPALPLGTYETAGSCDLSVPIEMPLITDLCDPTASFVPNPPVTNNGVTIFIQNGFWVATFPVGTTNVSTTAVDACGNSTPVSYSITIIDNELPIVQNCPTVGIQVNAEPGVCEATVDFDIPAVTDNCDITELNITFSGNAIGNSTGINIFGGNANGGGIGSALFQKGNTDITFSYTDENGNTNSNCSYSVNVSDTEPPTTDLTSSTTPLLTSGGADCPSTASTSLLALSSSGFGLDYTVAGLPFTGPIASNFFDNCPISDGSLDVTDVTITADPNGCNTTIDIEWTYTDCGGNPIAMPIVQSYTITDDEAPVGTAPAGMTDINACEADALLAVPAFDASSIASNYADPNSCNPVTVSQVGTGVLGGGDCQNAGGWTVTYTYDVTDGCNTLSGETIVHSGYDQNAPTLIGAAPSGTTGINDCASNALTAVPAFVPADVALFYEDDCNSVTVTLVSTVDSGDDCLSTGGWTVTYTYDVADNCGNTLAGQTLVHSGYDQDAPMGSPPTGMTDINVCLADALNAAAFDPLDAAQGYTDVCNNVNITHISSEIVTGSTDCEWQVIHTFDVADDCGNTIVPSQTYTDSGGNVTPLTIPAAQQQADIIEFTVTTDCNRNARIDIPVISDACGNAIPQDGSVGPGVAGWTITSSDNNLSFIDNGIFWDGDFQVGVTMVTITGTDICGNQVSDVIMVEVIDNIAPTIVQGNFAIPCPGPVVTLPADPNCEAEFIWDDPGFMDNCDIPGGTISFNKTIPPISRPFSATGGVTNAVTFPLGTTTVTYTVFDNATPPNSSSSLCTFDVVVVDGVAPSAICPTIADIQLDANGAGTLLANIGGGLSTDNCASSTVTETSPAASFGCADLGVQSVTLTATDSDGNMDTATCTFNVVDNIPPTAQCNNVTMNLDANGAAVVALSTIDASTDNCGPVTASLSSTSFSCADIGTNMITLTVTDGSGNMSSCTATVTILDGLAPEAVCPATPTINLDQITGMVTLPVNLGTGQSTDNCGTVTEVNTTPSFDCADIGTHTFNLTATDGSGNSNTISCNVEIVDSSGPIFACPSPIIDFSTQSDCNVTIRATIPGITDNCDATSSLGFNNGGLPVQTDAVGNPISPVTISNLSIVNSDTEWQAEFPLGITFLTISATDAAGNTNQCTFTVTVEDNFDPDVVCVPLTVVLDGNGMGSIDVNDFTAGDNCGVASVTLTPSTFTCSDIGAPVDATFNVIDDDNNVNSCVSQVTIVDNEDPVITLVGNSFEFPSCSGNAYNDLGVTVTDNCGNALTPTVTGSVDLSTPGTYTLTYSVSDASGNSASVTRTVMVSDPLGGITVGAITGDAVVCAGIDGFSYSIPSLPGTATITWSHSLGTAQFVSGQGSSSVIVNFPDDLSLADGFCVTDGAGTPGGTIDVTITGGCSPLTVSLPLTYLDDELCSVYNCFVDLHVNSALALPASDSPSLYIADQRISSDGIVQAGRTVDYIAGKCVLLKPGFEVELSAEFLADIAPCAAQQLLSNSEADQLIKALKSEGISLDKELLNISNEN